MVKVTRKTPFLSAMIKVFFHDATCKTRPTCKHSTFFEGLSFRNPKSHLKVSKSMCFKIIESHHTLNIIFICKTYVPTKPIYRTYCGVNPLSPDFKVFSFSISLSQAGKTRSSTTFPE